MAGKKNSSSKATDSKQAKAKKPTQAQKKHGKKTDGKHLSVYANLPDKKPSKKTGKEAKKAKDIADLPKHPVKRFFYRLQPKYWFNKKTGFTALKVLGVLILLGAIGVGSLFAYYRKDLAAISPGEIAKRVQSTVNTYVDRNGELLWEDKGNGNYKLVVDSEDISDHLKNATVAIEDKDFYKHSGVSITGLVRAVVNNATGGYTQGGSTLTQQLVKQVFFADEAADRSFGGIPRKIKELILAIEIERMYDKDQILTLYLNESPYGGRRNGAESGARTYFGKSAKDVTVAEAAFLAAIPQNPSLYNPYNIAGHKILIGRQHTVINNMVEQNFITKEEGEEAKAYPIIDKLLPETSQYDNIKAPHFVQMARAQVEKELGKSVVGRGGLTITTTLDIRIQDKLDQEMKSFFDSGIPASRNIGNGAATVEDIKTGQIVALVGSRDFNYPGYGQDNAATAFIQPGSTIKPFVYAALLKDKGTNQRNYGSGSILRDEPINDLYGAVLNNADRRFMGDLTIRQGLALSRNIPAAKAMYVAGIDDTISTIREMGNASYCIQEAAGGVGLASSIGGCGARQVEMVNAYATLARQGVYKPVALILEVKDMAGDTLMQWEDEGTQVIDPQIAYILSDILSDVNARAGLHGRFPAGLYVNGVRTAGKTGTSDKNGRSKDLWIASYSTSLSMAMWLGNSDTSNVNATSVIGGRVMSNTLEYAHKEVYGPEGKWKADEWFKRPSGLQQSGKELYPSWWNKSQSEKEETRKFHILSKKLIQENQCVAFPEAIVELPVVVTVDPATKRESIRAPEGYITNETENCASYTPISVSSDTSGMTLNITVAGSVKPSSVSLTLNGGTSVTPTSSGNGLYTYTHDSALPSDISIKLTYSNGYTRTIDL